jgi:hypothetical protein
MVEGQRRGDLKKTHQRIGIGAPAVRSKIDDRRKGTAGFILSAVYCRNNHCVERL